MLRLLPDVFWSLTVGELFVMAEHVAEDEKRMAEDRYFLFAWQTSHLMNATGNMKKPITPHKLLGQPAPGGLAPARYESREAKMAALDQLKKQFQP